MTLERLSPLKVLRQDNRAKCNNGMLLFLEIIKSSTDIFHLKLWKTNTFMSSFTKNKICELSIANNFSCYKDKQ